MVTVDDQVDADGWTQVAAAWDLDAIYELPGLGIPLINSIKLETVADVFNYQAASIVVVQPSDGDFIQGLEELRDFTHPLDAIYVFGGSVTRLKPATLGLYQGAWLEPAASVYIPTSADLYAAQAGGIVLWDRFTKVGS